MRKTIYASALVLALCGSALAGDMNSPPAPVSESIANTSLAAEESSPSTTAPEPTDDPPADLLVEAALTVLDSVLALF
jgi:hypothetical protein